MKKLDELIKTTSVIKTTIVNLTDGTEAKIGETIYGTTFKNGKQEVVGILIDKEFLNSDFNSKYISTHFSKGYAEKWLTDNKEDLSVIILEALSMHQCYHDKIKTLYTAYDLSCSEKLTRTIYDMACNMVIDTSQIQKLPYERIIIMLMEDIKKSEMISNLS